MTDFWTLGTIHRAKVRRGEIDGYVIRERGWLSPDGLIGLGADGRPVAIRTERDKPATFARADINGWDQQLVWRLHSQPKGWFLAVCRGPAAAAGLAAELIETGIAARYSDTDKATEDDALALARVVSRWASEGDAVVAVTHRRELDRLLGVTT